MSSIPEAARLLIGVAAGTARETVSNPSITQPEALQSITAIRTMIGCYRELITIGRNGNYEYQVRSKDAAEKKDYDQATHWLGLLESHYIADAAAR